MERDAKLMHLRRLEGATEKEQIVFSLVSFSLGGCLAMTPLVGAARAFFTLWVILNVLNLIKSATMFSSSF